MGCTTTTTDYVMSSRAIARLPALMAVLTRSLGLCGWLQRCLCFLMYCSSGDADGADDDSDADGAALNP